MRLPTYGTYCMRQSAFNSTVACEVSISEAVIRSRLLGVDLRPLASGSIDETDYEINRITGALSAHSIQK